VRVLAAYMFEGNIFEIVVMHGCIIVHNTNVDHHLGIVYNLANVDLIMDFVKVGGEMRDVGTKGLQIVVYMTLRVTLGCINCAVSLVSKHTKGDNLCLPHRS
jgi:hypothetical protein